MANKKTTPKKVISADVAEKKPETYDMPTAADYYAGKGNASNVVHDLTTEDNKEDAPKATHFRFITTLNNVNIGNAIHNNVQVVIFQCVATDEKTAIKLFRDKVAKSMGSVADYATYFRAVFGDAVTIESYSDGSVSRRVVPCNL